MSFSPPGAEKKGPELRLPAPECECNLLDAFIINRDRKLFPITRYFLSFFPFHSRSVFLSRFLKQRALAARCQEPINSLLMAAPMPSHSSARLLKSIRSFMDDLGEKKSPFGGEIIFSPSLPLLFFICRGQRQAQARGGEQAAEADEIRRNKRACFHGNALKRGEEIWGGGVPRAEEKAGGGRLQWRHRSVARAGKRRINAAGSFPAGIASRLKLLKIYFFLISVGLGQILPGRSSRTGARISIWPWSGSCFAAVSRFGGPGEAGAGEI